MRTLRPLVSSLLLAAVLAGCQSQLFATHPDSSQIYYVNPTDNNQLVSLHPGDKLVVSLPVQNGGQWLLLQSVAPTLLTDYAPGPVGAASARVFNTPTLSVGGPSHFVFLANAQGHELLSFASRPGTRYTGAGSTYNLRVTVQAAAPKP